MPSRIESPLLGGAYFPSENIVHGAPAVPAASASLPRAQPPAASQANRSGSQNLRRFFASLNCFDREPPNLDVTTHAGRVNYQLAVRAWAARPARYVQESDERKEIAKRIDRWLEAGDLSAMLKLSGADITSLPPLPSTLLYLDARNVFGAHGPKKYPKTWPAGLRELNISNNNLKKLPDNLPATLTELSAINCSLRRLPTLPQSLEYLYVSDNALDALPELPPRLAVLNVDFNKLTGIAPALPDTLTRLNLRNNPIASLPQLPAHLDYLNISHTRVTELAEGVRQAVTRPHAPMMLVAQGITLAGFATGQANQPALGVVNHYGVGMASPSLSQAVEAWYGTPDAGRGAAWNQIYEDSQDGFANATVPLWKVLDSLKGTADYPSEVGDRPATAQGRNEVRTAFRQRVTDLLGAMEKDPDLRKTCLAIAEDKVETCHDNLALGFDEMEQAHLAARATTGEFSQAALFDMGVGRLKLLLLDELAIPKGNAVALAVAAETGRPPAQVLETVEVVLAYRLGLAERLDLPTKTKHMHYLATAQVTQQDLAAAEASVKGVIADGGRVAGFMAAWRPWQVELERRHPSEFNPQDLSDAQDALTDEMERAQADYDKASAEHGAYSAEALDALGAVNGFIGKFAALDDKVFGPARERLTRAYMELA